MLKERIVLTGTCDFCGKEMDETEVERLPRNSNRFILLNIQVSLVSGSMKSEARNIQGIACDDCRRVLENWFRARITGDGTWES